MEEGGGDGGREGGREGKKESKRKRDVGTVSEGKRERWCSLHVACKRELWELLDHESSLTPCMSILSQW